MSQTGQSPSLVRGIALRFARSGTLLGVCAAGIALTSAWRLRWLCDDAFISFRYAANWSAGLGLVYNAGEWVEGYTNFLWTLLIGLCLRWGWRPESSAIMLGLAAFAGVLALLGCWSFHLQNGTIGRRAGPRRPLHATVWPIALVGFAAHLHARVYATGGLETSLFTLLVFSGSTLVALDRGAARPRGPAGLVLGFLLLAAGTLTRPEGVVFFAGSTAAIALNLSRGALSGRKLLRAASGPFAYLLVVAVFLFWRVQTYGYFLPNTYYAKSGGSAHYGQGLIYVGLYFASYYIFLALPVGAGLWLWSRRRPGGPFSRENEGEPGRGSGQRFGVRRAAKPGVLQRGSLRFVAAMVSPVILLLAYYVRVGGGFMFGRFLIPLTPFLFLWLEVLLLRLLPERGRAWSLLLVAVFTLASWNPYRGRPLPQIAGISQEHEIYRRPVVERAAAVVTTWQDAFRRADLRIAIAGAQAFVAYYSRAPYVLEAAGGLTDAVLAHQPLAGRGSTMGHERRAPLGYLRERRIHLHLNADFLGGVPAYALVRYPLGQAAIISYEPRVMDELRRLPGFEVPRFEDYLDGYLDRMRRLPTAHLRRDLADFDQFYFRFVPGDQRRLLLARELESGSAR